MKEARWPRREGGQRASLHIRTKQALKLGAQMGHSALTTWSKYYLSLVFRNHMLVIEAPNRYVT